MQVCLGVLYAWSVFRTPLSQLHPAWTKADTLAPFNYMLLCFTIAMVVAGLWQDRMGPRVVGSFGGLLLGTGCLIASFTCSTPSGLLLAYGVLGGLGVGCAYVTPIATCVKWFPDRRGMISGLAVMGFGAGAVIFAPLLNTLIGQHKLDPQTYATTIPMTFRVLAAIMYVIVIGAAQVFRVPPAGWKPSGWNPPQTQAKSASADYSTARMLSTWQIYALWIAYFLGSSVGLTVIGEARPYIEQLLKSAPGSGMTDAAAAAAATGAVMIIGLFNGGGRLFWGFVSDKIGRNVSTVLMSAVLAVACRFLLRDAGTYSAAMYGICLVGLAFGGFLALMPAFCADYYGSKNFGLNYGVLFSAYGLAGFFVPKHFSEYLGTMKVSPAAGYAQVFTTLAIGAVIALVLAAIVRKPAGNTAPAPAEQPQTVPQS
jgi:MFS transporter, OFA family, oxalate/formate antiporter